jgi:hypothetical protein
VETAEVNAVDGLRVLVVEDEVLLALALGTTSSRPAAP